MRKALSALIQQEQGATMIEYAFITSLIALVVIGGLTAISGGLALFF
jgi:pilus assembly protein Flp/PilA